MSNSDPPAGDETNPYFDLGNVPQDSGELTCSIDSSHGTTPKSEREVIDSEPVLVSGTLIGRYRIVRTLGSGGFGVVYLAHDTSLGRDVAVKVSRTLESLPNRTRDSLIVEARAAAALDHQNIIRVYDVDQWQDCTYVVMELVQGKSLADEIALRTEIPMRRILSIATQIAAALEHLHSKGIIHRDLKPANILLSQTDTVKVTDLGLALTDDSPLWKKRHIAGTRRYMSPEQVLGEIHRIDGRTDIWGFGVVLYEMLTLHSPFRATDKVDVFQSILKEEVPSPRQRRPETPDSLERMCLKCLSQRMSARFQSAKELREAIEYVQRELESSQTLASMPVDSHQVQATAIVDSASKSAASSSAVSKTDRPNPSTHSDQNDLKGLVPRGFRPFGRDDSEYYYRMMPGPYDLQGRPSILTFWQSWAKSETKDTEHVGVVYGPSGCGKSSFVQAALIPSLPPYIKPIYFNFTIRNPIDELVRTLQEEFEFTRSLHELPQVLAAIRRRQSPFKLLLILDQFEQYLVDSKIDFGHVMVQSLRQCDGRNVQAMILVRDEFWTEISLFMQMLESPLSDARNAASLPLLNIPHARKVLEGFGRAYEALPNAEHELTPSQQQFIELAIDRLASDNLVLCVRVAMFAELMRNYTWDKQTIAKFGGVDGAISRFLADTFDSQTAPKSRQSIANACSEILRELLPDDDRELKSSAKPISVLARSANLAKSSIPFAQAIQCLESDLKLISRQLATSEPEEYYSLAHDYLVRPIQTWLTDRDNATWRGRAIQNLAQATKRMERDPNARHLLSIPEWLVASAAIPKRSRTRAQQALMVASGRRARNRCTIALLLTLALAGIGRQWWKETARANENRGKIVQSDMGSFVVAKSQNLKQIWPQLRNNKSLAVAQLNAMELESADPVALNRRRLLISLLGQELPTDEVIDAVLVADDHEYSMWKQAFQQVPLRDSLLAKFQPISSSVDVRVPPQVQWLFLACSDYRLLDAVPTAADPNVEMFKVLASADGEPDELLAKVARELFDIYQVRPREAEFASVFSVLLMSIVSEPRDLVWDELTTFVENGIKSPKRSTALPCQGLLTALQNRNVVIRPVPTSTEWTVDEPVHSHPFTMIQLPKGGMSYERVESVDRTTLKNERYEIHVDGGIWMSREEVPQSLIDVFLTERSDDHKPTNPNREREYAATAIRSRELFEFCNWLSEKGGLAPCYSFVKQGSPQLGNVYPLSNAPNIVWNRDADGYRIPIHSEFQYASASGDVGSYWDAIKGTKFCARLQSKHERLGDRPTWRGFSDAWGFRDLMGNAGEIIIDNDNNLSILMTSSNVDTLWYQPVPNSETEVSIFGFRIVRGPIRVTSH